MRRWLMAAAGAFSLSAMGAARALAQDGGEPELQMQREERREMRAERRAQRDTPPEYRNEAAPGQRHFHQERRESQPEVREDRRQDRREDRRDFRDDPPPDRPEFRQDRREDRPDDRRHRRDDRHEFGQERRDDSRAYRRDRRDYREFQRSWNRDRWRSDWSRRHRDNWWRSHRWFRDYSGVRVGFYFAPGYGYYHVPRNHWGVRWSAGQYLPSTFWRYRLNDWSWYGLPWPPVGSRWVYVDNHAYLIDEYDGYILDVIWDVWRW